MLYNDAWSTENSQKDVTLSSRL